MKKLSPDDGRSATISYTRFAATDKSINKL